MRSTSTKNKCAESESGRHYVMSGECIWKGCGKKCIHNIDKDQETTLQWLKEIEMWLCHICRQVMYEELVY